MTDYLTAAEVEEIARGQRGTDHQRLAVQYMTLAQKLADSPCPVCMGRGTVWRGYVDEHGERWQREIDCPHCGDFSEERRGHFAERWQDAVDSLKVVKP